MKHSPLLLFFCAFALPLSGQSPTFSQFFGLPSAINPAYVSAVKGAGLRQVGGHLQPPVDEGADLRRDRRAALPRVGRHARRVDGLREAGGYQARAAGVHHRLADGLRRLGHPGPLETVIP